MDKLIIGVTVGYMLKVLKSETPVTEYKNEFDAIRHGDYIKFIDLVGGPMPYLTTYNGDTGMITSGYLPPQENDIGFELLIKTGPSLKIFLLKCLSKFGEIDDLDITDEIYYKLAIFEINLRMHASNYKLITVEDKLEAVIDKLGTFKNIPSGEIEKIHLGRKFLNMIKHKKKYFASWSEGIVAFNAANEILYQYDIRE